MMIRYTLFAGALAFTAIAGIASAQAKPPYQIVRTIEALHDQMVLGSWAARSAMPEVLRKLANKLVAAPNSAWHDPRNSRAVVIYILSGGEIRVAVKALESGKCAPLDKRLIKGALAYLEGKQDVAKSLLGSINPRSLEPAVGSQLALAQAAILAEDNKPKQAIAVLDLARVLAPGTLVEDAALRREVFLSEKVGDYEKFVSMAGQYLRRFSHSVYAPRFRKGLSTAIIHMAITGSAGGQERLVDLINGMSSHRQLALYLEIAEKAVTRGATEPTRWASAHALALAPKNSVDAERAKVYDGAASILTSDYDHGIAELRSLDPKRLSRTDADLAQAAIGMAKDIRKPPEGVITAMPEAVAATEPAGKEALPETLAQSVKSSNAVASQARQALAETKILLEAAQ